MSQTLPAKIELARQFIFECLLSRLHKTDLNNVSKLVLQPDLDWEVFLQLADAELVSPLLHKVLAGRQFVPLPVQKMLTRKFEYIARRNLILLHERNQISHLLHSAGIEAIVLKGAALAETVYKDFELRPMRDLDLLVRREELPTAVSLLAPAGYKQTSLIDRQSYPTVLEKNGIEPVFLELHHSLFHSLHYQQKLALDWFWQTAQTVTPSSQPMRVLGLEAQIIHLCGHLSLHHTQEPLMLWHNDLAELLSRYRDEIQWDIFIDKVNYFQLILPAQKILTPLAETWGAPIPTEVLEQLMALPISEEERRVFVLSTSASRSEGHGYWMRLHEIGGWRNRLFYVLQWLLPAPATMRSRYGISRRALVPLAYPYHWWSALRLAAEALFTRHGNTNSSR